MSSSSTSSPIFYFSAPSRAFTPAPPKDYAAAFATLQSAYGLGGQAPSITSKKIRSKTTKSSTSVDSDSLRSSLTEKSYESAFGALSSQFGFGGFASKNPSV
ncbi:hypothetical protein DFH08DRAFT_942122 [Mycena albidolilacea]|uniref:Uncharacterized protein n=1 Tax=Mycena albidolilacea TaxID=1033008 RepID=A0AAD7EGQ0_9AGAR|nr:hypothetical protein DFH08DRAFT_942122 [Mycena albidolilacea]